MLPIQREPLPSERLGDEENQQEIDSYYRLRRLCFDLSKQLRESLASLRHIHEQKESLKREFAAIIRSSYLIRSAIFALSIFPAPGKSMAIALLLFRGYKNSLKREEFHAVQTKQISTLEEMYTDVNEKVDNLLCIIENILNISREEAQEIFSEFGVDSWEQDGTFVAFDFRETADVRESINDENPIIDADCLMFTDSTCRTNDEQTPAKLFLDD
jgi:signal transduction histidine kinase